MKSFKIGDEVIVRSYSEISSQFEPLTQRLPSGCWFPDEMKKYCGNVYCVVEVRGLNPNVRYILDCGDTSWVFTDDMLCLYERPVPKLTFTFGDLIGE